MHAVKLAILLALSVGCLVDLARSDAALQINDALKNRSWNEDTVESYIAAAQSFLESQTKGVHLFNGDTLSLLKKFIEVGKAIQAEDCSANTRLLLSSLPIKEGSDYSTWSLALYVFAVRHSTTCSEKLQENEKELYATLDQKRMNQISQLTEIAIPIIRDDNALEGAALMRHLKKHTDLLNRLKTDGSAQFGKELLSYFENIGKQLPVAESFREYVSKPCQYYTGATSSIFELYISDYGDLYSTEEFKVHLISYQLCRFLEREKSTLLRSLEAQCQ